VSSRLLRWIGCWYPWHFLRVSLARSIRAVVAYGWSNSQ